MALFYMIFNFLYFAELVYHAINNLQIDCICTLCIAKQFLQKVSFIFYIIVVDFQHNALPTSINFEKCSSFPEQQRNIDTWKPSYDRMCNTNYSSEWFTGMKNTLPVEIGVVKNRQLVDLGVSLWHKTLWHLMKSCHKTLLTPSRPIPSILRLGSMETVCCK